jgi:hypothetical protein
MNKEILLKELKFCLNVWKEKEGCNFGGSTKCNQCAVPYLLLKMIDGTLLHDKEMERLTVNDWEEKLKQYEN